MQANEARTVGLEALGYYLPPKRLTVAEVVAAGHSSSPVERLIKLGHQFIHVAGDEPVESMALNAVRDMQKRHGIDLERIDLVLFGTGLTTSGMVNPGPDFKWADTDNPHPLLKFTGTRFAGELGLKCPVIGVSQLACSTFQGALRLARGMLFGEPSLHNILVIAADRFPSGVNREIVYTLVSDGACAGLVTRESKRNRILGFSQITRGTFWDNELNHDRLVAAYFPIARQAMNDALVMAGVKLDQLAAVIPHNVNAASWDVMGKILGVPKEKVFSRNIARTGHAVAADNVLNHVDAIECGAIEPGDKVMWFVTGFGAHWSATVVEV